MHRVTDSAATLLPEAARELDTAVARTLGPDVARIYTAAMARTLEQTLHRMEDGTVFVITGDIPAMWLRDSATQMWPYLPLAATDPDGPLADVLVGIVARQLAYVSHDPYANAFNAAPDGRCHEPRDLAEDPWLWEQKFELDSLSFPLQLAHQLWLATGRVDHLGGLPAAARAVLSTCRRETRHETESEYRFVRPDTVAQDTLPRDGRGTPVAETGMVWAGFRPSDDACRYGYNVPGNLMLAHVLRLLPELCEAVDPGSELAAVAADALALAEQIEAGVDAHGVVEHPEHGRVLAYEVDGLGGVLLGDDANLPSLLSLPLTAGLAHDDPRYRATRSLVLSDTNPWYYRGRLAAGIGSPHTPPDHVWPIALAVEGLTSASPARRVELVRLLAATTGGTDHLHEGFHVDDDHVFTRSWFSWADSMFCALVQQVVAETEPSGASRWPS